MKDVGFTQEGGRLIEMNQDEYRQFDMLCRAVEGRVPEIYSLEHYAFREGFDFTKTFDVIRAYYSQKFRVHEMQTLLDSVKESLERV